MYSIIWDIATKELEFDEMLGQIIESNPKFEKNKEDFEKAIEQFSDNLKLYDSIDTSAFAMVAVASEIAFKTGFDEGIRFIISALTGKEVFGI